MRKLMLRRSSADPPLRDVDPPCDVDARVGITGSLAGSAHPSPATDQDGSCG
jgi:hypothetical protein